MKAERKQPAKVLRLGVVGASALWSVVPLVRQACCNSQIIMATRVRGRQGAWDGLRSVVGGFVFPLVNCWRTAKTVIWIAGGQAGNDHGGSLSGGKHL